MKERQREWGEGEKQRDIEEKTETERKKRHTKKGIERNRELREEEKRK